MSNQEMKNQIFEVMLKAAIKESFENEVRAYPSADTLTEDYNLSLATHRKIERMIRDSSQKLAQLQIKKVAKKAAVIAAITIPVSIFGLFSVDASRNAIFNALLEWKADHLDIKYEDKNSNSSTVGSSAPSTAAVLKPKYIPDGFSETETKQTSSSYTVYYKNADNEVIVFRTFSIKDEGIFSVDTEQTVLKELTINGVKAKLFESKKEEQSSYLVWSVKSNSFVIVSKIPSNQLILMAESMLK
ncbi:MAG: DUF4367 domain-containing protein [Clostridium sp.]|uniref:DUF4367 domain-containing protein n=1 Tax=Clostridium sp. TaxID=1506 RepID=UPI00290DFDCD|nr:DUF4367 domain-containing protein [Clostridium sp.]MDU7338336.1 DUF4367 domain-containing protein [Clostridium sp.]